MIGIHISNTSEKPIYQQLYEQISSQILNGTFESGYGLPPIRTAAKELRVSIITVKKAWEELERKKLIYTVTGRGCFVSSLTAEERKEKRNEIIKVQLTNDLKFYKELGITEEDLFMLIRETWQSYIP